MADDSATGTYYIIKVREKLDERWREWFDGMSMGAGEEGTVLAGFLPDQSALHGVIGRVQRLGLHLVAVHQENPPAEPPPEA